MISNFPTFLMMKDQKNRSFKKNLIFLRLTVRMVRELHSTQQECSDRSCFAGRTDPVTYRINRKPRAGMQMRRRFFRRFGHQPTHVAILINLNPIQPFNSISILTGDQNNKTIQSSTGGANRWRCSPLKTRETGRR